MIGGVLGVHARRDDKDQVGFTDHLYRFHAPFNASFYTKPERLKRENSEAFSCTNSECVLILVKAHMCDA